MSAAHALVSMGPPASLNRLPLSEAIRGLAGMADDSVHTDGINDGQNQPSVAVLVDTEVDGARYLLVRMPKLEHQDPPEDAFNSRSPRNSADGPPSERRRRFGDLRRVLVAESDSDTRLRLVHLLREWGFRVVVATDGIEALGVVELQQPPDFFFINRSLAGMNGIELCRRICDRFSEHSPYIVMMGKPAGRQEVVESLESGATEYLITPFDEQELRARLIVAVRTLDRQDSLISSREQFRDQATRDALTGVWNRRGILEILEKELDRAEHNGRSTGILMLDLDHFKNVNDAHGHLTGDLVLQDTARRLCRKLRAYDRLGRYGGEEFLIVVPATNEKELGELAERIRASTESEPVPTELIDIRITLSIGAAIAKPGQWSKAKLIAVADEALYEAKRLGRNRSAFGQ
jgi:two-component system cell cycle response regulator